MVTGIGIFRFSDEGKVVESWDSMDQLGMMQQLGVVAT
jgi:predicted SnoaL-like aldol condensation-catalyzing enzyme